MLEQKLRIYSLLDRLFPRSYAAKFLVVAFVATHLPLLTVAIAYALNSEIPRTAFLLDVFIATLVGFGVMWLLIPSLLAPLEHILDLLENDDTLPDINTLSINTLSQDASGILLRRTTAILQRLRSSEQRYTALFQAIPDGISCFNRQGEYTEVKLPRYFSYVQPNLVGKTPEDLYTPAMAAMIRERRQRMWETGETQTYELERIIDGHTNYREVSIFLLSDSEGAALVRDVSERKQAQQRLQESEARFRSFFEYSPNPCLMLESDGVEIVSKIHVNQAFADFVGIGSVPENIDTMKTADILGYVESISHPDDYAQDAKYLQEVVSGERNYYRMEKRYRHADGTWRWGDYSNSVIRDEEGNVVRLLATIQDITARKRAEQQVELTLERLHVSEAKFRAFFEDSSMPCFIVTIHDEADASEQNMQLLVNQAFCDFLGEDADKLRMMTLAETATYNQRISHPDDFTAEQALVDELFAGNQSHYRIEKRYLRSDGQVLWGDLTHHVLRDEQGNIYQFIALIQDITERKQAQTNLQEALRQLETSTAKFRAFFEDSTLPSFIIIMQPDDALEQQGQFLVNQAFCDFLGEDADNLQGMTFADIEAYTERVTHPSDMAAEQALANAFFTQNQSHYRIEKRFVRPDGSIVWGDLTNHALRDGSGNIYQFIALIQDITEQKRAQIRLQDTLEQLEASEVKFRAFFEGSGSAHSIITMQNPDTPRPDRLLTNRAYDRLMADTLVADTPVRTLADITTLNNAVTHPEDLVVEDENNQALVSGQIDHYNLEKRIFKHGGDIIWTTVTDSLIRHADGTPRLLVSTVQDITNLKRTQDHLSQTLSRLEHALEAKNMLMREIHHRVKNNLQVIASLLHLQTSIVQDAEAKNALQESRKRVMAMAEIHELMHHTNTAQQDVSNTIDFAHYLQELINLMQRSYQIEDIRFSLELDPVTLPLDHAIPLALITNELVSNALKYAFRKATPEQPTITIGLQQNDTTISLHVADNGTGLDVNPHKQQHEGHTDRQSLGMTIIESLSDQLGGTLSFDSQPVTSAATDATGLCVSLHFPMLTDNVKR